MYKYGKTSMSRLDTCHPDLQKLFKELIKYVDISILCGHRTEEEQTKAVLEKRSKTPYPKIFSFDWEVYLNPLRTTYPISLHSLYSLGPIIKQIQII